MTAVQSACPGHCLEMRDGRFAHGMWRQAGSPEDDDDIPAGAVVEVFRSESSGSE
jgi:hypothetical protein